MRTPAKWDIPTVPFRGGDVPVTDDVLRSAVARGVLTRPHRGVYLLATALDGDPRDAHLMRALARQTACPELVASHETAALAHGIYLPNTASTIHAAPRFTLAKTPARRSGGPGRACLQPLPNEQVMTLDNELRVTTPARTAVDLAAALPLPEALMALDAAARLEALKHVDRWRLRGPIDPWLRETALAALAEAADVAAHRRTRRRLQLALRHVDPRRESPGESLAAGWFVLDGLPEPECQFPIETNLDVVYSDFGREDFGVVAEADGAVKYGSLAQVNLAGENTSLVRQLVRHQAITNRGWTVGRWSVSEFARDPHPHLANLRNLLRVGGWTG